MSDDDEFKDLEAVVNKLVQELFDSEAFKELAPDKKVVYDFTLKVKQGKNVLKTIEGTKLESMVDVIDEGSSYRILFEIPGLEEDKMDLKISPLDFNLKVKGLAGVYTKTISFKDLVSVDSVKANYNNGVLEVVVLKESKKAVVKRKV